MATNRFTREAKRERLHERMQNEARRINEANSLSKANVGTLKKEIAEIEAQHQTERLDFSKDLTEERAYYWDDTLEIRADKHYVSPDRTKESRFPLNENWKYAKYNGQRILKATETGNFFNHEMCKQISEKDLSTLPEDEKKRYSPVHRYSINTAALRLAEKNTDKKSILNDIRFRVEANEIYITLNGVLLTHARKSRLKLLVETVRILAKTGIIKGDWSEESEKVMPYNILKQYFHAHKYDIRIDSGRYGEDFYRAAKNTPLAKKYRDKNVAANESFNQAPIYSQKKSTLNQRGFNVVVYDRSLLPYNIKEDPERFPIRLEVRLKSKLLKGSVNDLFKGNGEKVIKRIQTEVKERLLGAVKRIKAPIAFDKFINQNKTRESPEEIIDRLLDSESYLSRSKSIKRKGFFSIEELAKYHGQTLPNQRGNKYI